jgi:hypothetical protein
MAKTPLLLQGGAEIEAPRELVDLCQRAWSIKTQIDFLSESMTKTKKLIAEALDDDGTVLLPGVCRVTCAKRSTVAIAKIEELRAVLGQRFDDLTEEKTTYAPEKRLLDIAANPGHMLHAAVLDCLSTTVTTSVTLRAEAPAKASATHAERALT